AAEAGKVLTAEPDPNEPLDLTGDVGFLTGSGERYVGGVTAAQGRSKKAVYDQKARPDGVLGGKGKQPVKVTPKKDLSRPPMVLDKAALTRCPFPPEADVEQINYMRVPTVVTIGADGKPQSVAILNDPGYGFGRNARR